MDPRMQKTPVKKVFSPCENSPNGTFGRASTTENSPAYVKWDFLRPPVSENIRNAASKLEEELNECNLKRKRSLVDSPKSCFERKIAKIKGENKTTALSCSVRRLKDTIDEVLNPKTATDSNNSPTKPLREKTGFKISTDLFEGKENRKKTAKKFPNNETENTTKVNHHQEFGLSTKTKNHTPKAVFKKEESVPELCPSDIWLEGDFADDSIFESIDNRNLHWKNSQNNNDEISNALNDSFDTVLIDCSQRIESQFSGNSER